MSDPSPTSADSSGVPAKRPLSAAQLHQRRTAPLRHGLFAKSSTARRIRRYRAGRLLSRALAVFAEQNRPVNPLQQPLLLAWCQFECLAVDLYQLVVDQPDNAKALDQYLGVRRGQVRYAELLGMSPASETVLAKHLMQLERDRQVAETHRKLKDEYSGPWPVRVVPPADIEAPA